MSHDTCELAARLARAAEAVCRHYLSNGRREGAYWRVGDVRNTPGRSLFVRLRGDGNGRAPGKWTDAATGEHGDLLDLIRESCGLVDFQDVAEEARRFLALPRERERRTIGSTSAQGGSPHTARRLFAASQPIRGTLAERYLRAHGIEGISDARALRFHPRCYYRPEAHDPPETWPAMIAAVTDLAGAVTGVHRTWLIPSRHGRPPCVKDRRAIGHLLGNGVRFGAANDVLLAGEGIETTLSLGIAMPTMPLEAALSAAHLGALLLPCSLQRLYVARDADAAGDHTFERLCARAAHAGIEAIGLSPRLDDFNSDLMRYGADALRRTLARQLASRDAQRFLSTSLLVRPMAVQVTRRIAPMAKVASQPTRTRAERLEARVTAEQKALIERAAALEGRTLTDFVLASLQDAARRTIEEHEQLRLSVRDSAAFVDALLNPKPVSARLKETVRRYRTATGA